MSSPAKPGSFTASASRALRITDCPSTGHGRRYLVERGLEELS